MTVDDLNERQQEIYDATILLINEMHVTREEKEFYVALLDSIVDMILLERRKRKYESQKK